MARLGDICEVLNGYAFKSEKYTSSGVRIIRIANVQKGYIEDTAPAFYPIDTTDIEKYTLYEDDLLISLTGNVGRVALLKKEFLPAALNQRVACLRLKDSARYDKSFLYCFLNSDYFENKCIQSAKGVAQKNMSTEWLKEYQIPNLSLEEQKEIAAVLNKISELISARTMQLQKLDELVKSRFIEMFGMLNVNNKNWPQKSLGQACEQIKRYPTFCNMEYLQSGVRVIRIGNILLDGHLDTSDENYVFVYENANSDYPDTVIEENDIIMAVRGDGSAAKRIGIVTEPKLIGANISPNLIRIKAKKEMLVSLFLFYYLTGEVGQARLDAFVNKTAKKNIAAKDIVKVITPIPPIQLQREFAAFVEQVDKSKLAIQQSLEKLETLKKALMQQYFG